MKERPIIYNAEMVRATLEDRKAKTRRVIKPQPEVQGNKSAWELQWKDKLVQRSQLALLCPYGQVGDRLWVRETFCDYCTSDAAIKSVCYKACPEEQPAMDFCQEIHWRPSIHLPRWASRITLEITEIRVERLQEITEEDANEEGNPYPDMGGKGSLPPLWWFKELWDSLNAKRGYSWDSNPWVWVISFKRI